MSMGHQPEPGGFSHLSVPKSQSAPTRYPPAQPMHGRKEALPSPPLQDTPIPPSIRPSPGSSLQPKRRVQRWLIGGLVLLLLLGSTLGAFFWLTTRASVPGANQIGGYAFFVNSGDLKEGSSLGINDQLRIVLHNIPNPDPGKSYYAWLLGDRVANQNVGQCQAQDLMIPVGKLPVQQGEVNYPYSGDAAHTDLLGCTSRLLITEEGTGRTPTHYSSDKSTWRYYAEIPQTHTINGQSVLYYLRNFLYEGANIKLKQVHGGLNLLLLKTMQKVWEWVSSARDSRDVGFIHRQLERTLAYIDGEKRVCVDVPGCTPQLITSLQIDPSLITIPLLNLKTLQLKGDGDSYPGRIYRQLPALIAAPGATSAMRTIASQVGRVLKQFVNPALLLLHQYALELIKMPTAQLLQPTAFQLLNAMQIQADTAFFGRLDPSTNELQPGVVQIYYDIQHLATFQVTSCPCPEA